MAKIAWQTHFICGVGELDSETHNMSRGLYEVFLEMMRDLDQFRGEYIERHHIEGLDRDDPDVRRLTEAMGFFAARAQYAGQSYLDIMRRTLLQEFFPYLLSPVPALGMLRAVPTAKMSEVTVLPFGTVLAATNPAVDRTAVVRTLDELTIMPIEMYRLDQIQQGEDGVRLQMRFKGAYKRNDEIGDLRVYVDQLGDFISSIRVLNAIKHGLVRAAVVFTEDESSLIRPEDGQSLHVEFPESQASHSQEFRHPIERERWFFQQPERALFFNLCLTDVPRNWRTFTVILDINDWPAQVRLTQDSLKLFVVPVANIVRDFAEPVLYEGTVETITVRHPSTSQRYAPHSVVGVYRIEDGEMLPLQNGVVSSASGSYQALDDGRRSSELNSRISIKLPEAFDSSVVLSVDAFWHQPWLSELSRERLDYRLYRSSEAGIRWDALGDLVPFGRPASWGGDDEYLRLFTLQNKSVLNHDDIQALLAALGAVGQRAFSSVTSAWRGTLCEQMPNQRSSAGLKTVFTFQFNRLSDDLQPVADAWVEHVCMVLNAWMADTTVESRVEYAE